jgi:hypothetical protein
MIEFTQRDDGAVTDRPENHGKKPAFEEPKLAFIEPKLTPRGDLRDTTGFFTTFSP